MRGAMDRALPRLAPGWQREIGFWNVAMIVILLGVLVSKDARAAMYVVRGLIVLSLLLGTNHLMAIVSEPTGWAHYTPMVVNYAAVVWAWTILRSARK